MSNVLLPQPRMRWDDRWTPTTRSKHSDVHFCCAIRFQSVWGVTLEETSWHIFSRLLLRWNCWGGWSVLRYCRRRWQEELISSLGSRLRRRGGDLLLPWCVRLVSRYRILNYGYQESNVYCGTCSVEIELNEDSVGVYCMDYSCVIAPLASWRRDRIYVMSRVLNNPLSMRSFLIPANSSKWGLYTIIRWLEQSPFICQVIINTRFR